MKKFLAILLTLAFSFYPVASFAETVLEQLDIPADYKAWADTEKTCTMGGGTVITTAYINLEKDKNKLSVIAVLKVNNSLVYTLWYGGSMDKAKFGYEYLLKSDKCLKFDTMHNSEDGDKLEQMFYDTLAKMLNNPDAMPLLNIAGCEPLSVVNDLVNSTLRNLK